MTGPTAPVKITSRHPVFYLLAKLSHYVVNYTALCGKNKDIAPDQGAPVHGISQRRNSRPLDYRSLHQRGNSQAILRRSWNVDPGIYRLFGCEATWSGCRWADGYVRCIYIDWPEYIDCAGSFTPSALFFSILAAIGRMYRDTEMPALYATGVSPGGILESVAKLSLVIALITGFISIAGRPWAYRESYRIEAEARQI